eukprot:m.185575 g.185575  ORF g.185575 m.185575 type:complete len:519 (+) comp16481_c0_seq1:78-1634(+)
MHTLWVVSCIAYTVGTVIPHNPPSHTLHRSPASLPQSAAHHEVVHATKATGGVTTTGAVHMSPTNLPNVVGYNATWMAHVRALSLAGTLPAYLQRPLVALKQAADGTLPFKGSDHCPEAGPWTVTANPMTPPSGNKHDFSYVSTYAWPCNASCPQSFGAHCNQWWRRPSWDKNTSEPFPDWSKCHNATGLPWWSHDGFGQPMGQHDTSCSVLMSDSVITLALAYYFTGNETYARGAAHLLETWFVNPETAMHPSLSFAGYVPGANNGSSSGIIATSLRWNSKVTDAAHLIESSSSWPTTSQTAFKAWNAAYVNWLTTSSMGMGEGHATNNHFTWYSVQTLSLALDGSNHALASALAARVTASSTPGAIQKQIKESGLMPLEANRDAGVSYSTMNVEGLFNLAQVVSNINGATDLWHYRQPDGTGSILSALKFLVSFGTNASHVWPYSQESKTSWADMPWTNLAVPMRVATIVYQDPSFEKMIPLLPWKDNQGDMFVHEDVSLLCWPAQPSALVGAPGQ